MWTDFDEPLHTIFAETAAARERARSKKRRKKSRSKRGSAGVPHATNDKATPEKPTLDTTGSQLTASAVQPDPVLSVLEACHEEQPEALQASTPHVASCIGALDSQVAQARLSQTEHDETSEVHTFAVLTEDAALLGPEKFGGVPVATSAPSVLCAIELKSLERSPRHGAFRRGGLAVMGFVSLLSALWLHNPISHLEAEAPGTIDQAPIAVRVWTDPPPLEQVRSAAEISPIALQPKQHVVAAPTGLAVVQETQAEVSPHTDIPENNRLVEATSVPSVLVPQEVVQSASFASVPLPPRRPVSLIIRHIPVAHLVAPTATVSTDAPAEQAVEQTQPFEPYTSFSARNHEIGTHKLAWGMARLHEDPNSDSSRGAVWDFVPSKP